jgi:hypothetical protein
MEYESFLSMAKVAIEQGCVIFRDYNGQVAKSKDLSIVISECRNYYFHLPIAGEIEVETRANGKEFVKRDDSSSGNTLIEAGFSYFNDKTG